MIVTIHQPEHLPWLGFFDKVRQADMFVMLDHVQFRKNYYQNRNRIRSADGAIWMTVPVLTKGHSSQAINQILINNQGSPRWRGKCWTSLVQCYRNAPYWSSYGAEFERLYQKTWARLVELNEAVIRFLLDALSIKTRIIKSSEVNTEGNRGDLVLNICRQVGADVYLSGVSGKEYLSYEKFAAAGIQLRFQQFHHPIYRQLYEPFIPCLSVIDLLFNYGPASMNVLRGIGVPTMQHVFE